MEKPDPFTTLKLFSDFSHYPGNIGLSGYSININWLNQIWYKRRATDREHYRIYSVSGSLFFLPLVFLNYRTIIYFLAFTKSKIAPTATPMAKPIAMLKEVLPEEIP